MTSWLIMKLWSRAHKRSLVVFSQKLRPSLLHGKCWLRKHSDDTAGFSSSPGFQICFFFLFWTTIWFVMKFFNILHLASDFRPLPEIFFQAFFSCKHLLENFPLGIFRFGTCQGNAGNFVSFLFFAIDAVDAVNAVFAIFAVTSGEVFPHGRPSSRHHHLYFRWGVWSLL